MHNESENIGMYLRSSWSARHCPLGPQSLHNAASGVPVPVDHMHRHTCDEMRQLFNDTNLHFSIIKFNRIEDLHPASPQSFKPKSPSSEAESARLYLPTFLHSAISGSRKGQQERLDIAPEPQASQGHCTLVESWWIATVVTRDEGSPACMRLRHDVASALPRDGWSLFRGPFRAC